MKTKLIIPFVLLALIGVGSFLLYTPEPKVKTTTPPQEVSSPEIMKKDSFIIVAFGDSLTAGLGVPLDESYPSLLEKDLAQKNIPAQVINMGVSGETTTASLDRVDFVISQKPSLVLLGIGANDMLRASSPTIAKMNLQTILQRFRQEGISVILLGMRSTSSNGSEYRKKFDEIYPSLAKEYSLPLVPFFLEGVALTPTLNTNDGIHPNKAGYEKIIKENILPVLVPVLKSKGL